MPEKIQPSEADIKKAQDLIAQRDALRNQTKELSAKLKELHIKSYPQRWYVLTTQKAHDDLFKAEKDKKITDKIAFVSEAILTALKRL